MSEQPRNRKEKAAGQAGNKGFVKRDGKIVSRDQRNIRLALTRLGFMPKFDLFRCRMVVDGLGVVDEAIAKQIWLQVDQKFGFLPPKDFFFDVLENVARQNAFHPVRDYLDSCRWDGTPRLGNWLTTYGGANDDELVRAMGWIFLVAAARRVRQPGVKFDVMLVLEGRQGIGKSQIVQCLAVRDDWFTDQLPLSANGKEAIEALSGRWIAEVAELAAFTKSDVENIKAFLSRQTDRGRLSYERLTSEMPRQCILIGTTNSECYLSDQTGNRRFWPVKLERIDIEGLRRDRDQLWAEAAYWEAKGESIQLDQKLWAYAAAEQGSRVLNDPYHLVIDEKLASLRGKIAKTDVYRLVELPVAHRHSGHEKRVGEVMRTLGWRASRLRRDAKLVHCFINCDEVDAAWITVQQGGDGVPYADYVREVKPRVRAI